jgi:hypothetical protein
MSRTLSQGHSIKIMTLNVMCSTGRHLPVFWGQPVASVFKSSILEIEATSSFAILASVYKATNHHIPFNVKLD